MPDLDRAFFVMRNGNAIADEDMAQKICRIKELAPDERLTATSSDSGFEWNEIGMACLFGEVYQKEARFCVEHKSWYTYSGGAWRRDEGSILVSEKLKDFVRLMTIYCGEIIDDDQRKAYSTFIAKMGDRRMRDRILKDATGELAISAVEFDKNPYLINCQNGTFDLSRMIFREHRWDDFITMQTDFKYTPIKVRGCSRWVQFIDEVTQGDKDKADYLQRALGYSLLGRSNEACMFILHGKTTRNGKSTLLGAIERMLGDYSRVSPVGMICKASYNKDPEAATPELVMLKGKRFVTMSESKEYGKLDEEKIKQYTGGEAVTGRALREAPISFIPQFTLWLSCNDLPTVTDKSLFASERVRIIEFNRHFSQEEQDKSLDDLFNLQESRSGIFTWLLEGYSNYCKRGLSMVENMKRVIRKYETDQDIVLQFLEANCERDEESKIKSKNLYSRFRTWAKVEYGWTLSAQKFNNEMERHDDWYHRAAVSMGYLTYYGLKLKEVLED